MTDPAKTILTYRIYIIFFSSQVSNRKPGIYLTM